MIYFDNAATTYPKPAAVQEIISRSMKEYGGNPGRSGHSLSLKTAEEVYRCREEAANFFGSQAEDVVFTQNCTMANNMAIKGILEFGDHVLISDLEHNSVTRPVFELSRRGIISYDVVPTYLSDTQTIRSFAERIRPNTKLICCTHGSNVFGITLPVGGIGKLARRRGIYMMVDAAQTAGVLDINMKRDNIDFLCTAGHKSLYGPFGTGLLITPHGEKLNTLLEGGTGSNSLELAQPRVMPDRLESGTVNVLGIAGLHQGIKFVREKGTTAIYHHEMDIIEHIAEELEPLEQVTLYVPTLRGRSLPVLSFNIAGLTGEQTAAMLNDHDIAVRGGYHCSMLAHQKMDTLSLGTARVSAGAFNTMKDAEKFCRIVKNYCHGLNKF